MSILALQDLLAALSSDASLSKIMYSLCSEVERIAPEVVVTTLRLDENRLIRPLAAPSMPSNYDEELDGMPIGPSMGTCGVAMTYARPHLTYDISVDPNWVQGKHLVGSLGLRTCWSHPITRRDGKVLGSLAFYFRELTVPNEFHQELAKVCSNLCTLAFEHEESQQDIRRLAFFDTLTGLPNRTMLTREAEQALVAAQDSRGGFALLFIDLDNLKAINDTYGHVGGDGVLRQIGKRMKESMREGDFIGRLAGDEFLAIIRDADAEKIKVVAEDMRVSVCKPVSISSVAGHVVEVTISVGAAVYPDDGHDFETLLDNADAAMYRAKTAGKNQIRFFGNGAASDSRSEPKSGDHASRPLAGEASIDQEIAPYGPHVKTVMWNLDIAMRSVVHIVVDQFYQQLSSMPGVQHLIDCLTPEEFGHLKRKLAENLLMLCSPDLTQEKHKVMALKVGHIHAVAGLQREYLVNSNDLLHAAVSRNVDRAVQAQALLVFGRRLVRDLGWQMTAAQTLQILRNNVLLDIGNLAWNADNYADLITRAAEILGSHGEIVGCVFTRPDAQGIYKVEAIGGEKTVDFIMHVEKQQLSWLDAGENPMKYSTAGRARESGRIERCLNFATDPRVAHWLPSLKKGGFRSGISLPLGSPHNEHPSIVLSAYSGMPGGFSSPEQDAFFTQIKDLLVFGINKLEAFKETPDTIPYSTRTRWRSLLRGSGLEMHYQPVMELPSGKVTKVEALARLRDGGDILTPGAFLPALTSDDLFVLYVEGLDKILAQRKAWASHGITLDLAINLPASALGNARYIAATQNALDKHGCPPAAITLEILETEEVAADVDLLAALKSYKKLGVQLAEDDLGSGYSTLARLREMPVDIIKIDRSIVGNAAEDPYNTLRFIYQLTRLGHGLGKKVVVEGVEDMALLHAVIRLGADCAQGYAIARPMPAAQLEHWLGQPHELSIPESEQLTHTLPRLADALVWEEDLHVIREETPFGGIRETVLGNIHAAMGDGRVLDTREQAAKADLIECAIKFGQRSNEYMAARNRLIELLVHDSWSTPAAALADQDAGRRPAAS